MEGGGMRPTKIPRRKIVGVCRDLDEYGKCQFNLSCGHMYQMIGVHQSAKMLPCPKCLKEEQEIFDEELPPRHLLAEEVDRLRNMIELIRTSGSMSEVRRISAMALAKKEES